MGYKRARREEQSRKKCCILVTKTAVKKRIKEMHLTALMCLCLGCLVQISNCEFNLNNVIFYPASQSREKFLSKVKAKISDRAATTEDGEPTTTEAPPTLKDLVEVSPVNAFVAAMTNLFGALLLALGSELVIVGRSIGGETLIKNDQQDKLLTMTLLMGSQGESLGCLHRAACEVPQRAQVYATSFTLLANIADMASKYFKIDDTDGNFEIIAKVLQESSRHGINQQSCSELFPCKIWKFLKNTSLQGTV